MRGRKPSPTQLKLVRGNPGKRPIRAAGEPKPGHTLPEAPVHLSARAKAAWGQIAPILSRMGVLTEADAVALELLCEAYADYSEARDELRAFGSNYYETTTRQGRPCDGCIPPYRSCRRPIAVSAIGWSSSARPRRPDLGSKSLCRRRRTIRPGSISPSDIALRSSGDARASRPSKKHRTGSRDRRGDWGTPALRTETEPRRSDPPSCSKTLWWRVRRTACPPFKAPKCRLTNSQSIDRPNAPTPGPNGAPRVSSTV